MKYMFLDSELSLSRSSRCRPSVPSGVVGGCWFFAPLRRQLALSVVLYSVAIAYIYLILRSLNCSSFRQDHNLPHRTIPDRVTFPDITKDAITIKRDYDSSHTLASSHVSLILLIRHFTSTYHTVIYRGNHSVRRYIYPHPFTGPDDILPRGKVLPPLRQRIPIRISVISRYPSSQAQPTVYTLHTITISCRFHRLPFLLRHPLRPGKSLLPDLLDSHHRAQLIMIGDNPLLLLLP
jgi:hypothetical protein